MCKHSDEDHDAKHDLFIFEISLKFIGNRNVLYVFCYYDKEEFLEFILSKYK